MQGDKYTALWVSHSSISDFLKCPRAYFLNNVYRDPRTRHKINLMSPPLALGQAVHEVIESLSLLPVEKRFEEPLMPKFDRVWKKVSGKKGGFFSTKIEEEYKNRGKEMLRRVLNNPGPLKNLAVKIQMDLPYYWLSEDENIILCGKIDWLEFLSEKQGVNIIDFKTGRKVEDSDSLQLPIYFLLVQNCQKYKVLKASYWYLERSDNPTVQPLPDVEKAHEQVLKISKKIKLAKQLRRFKCSHENGCSACRPLEAVIRGEAEFVGVDTFKQDIYVLRKGFKPEDKSEKESIIL